MNEYSEHDIIRYLDGEMTIDEKTAFEQDMRENESLRRETGEWQRVITGLRDKELRETRAMVGRFEKQSNAKPFPYLKIAAAVILLFTIGMFIYQWKPSDYTNYFEPYPNVVQTRGLPAGALDATMQAYTEGNYEKAIAGLVRMEKTDTISFYLGNAYLFNDQPDLAEEYLSRVEHTGSVFSQQAQWLRVRALLDQDKKEEAASLLETIESDTSHSYQEAAAQLYEDIF